MYGKEKWSRRNGPASRAVDGTFGAQIGASLIAANVIRGLPTERGYSLAFLVSTVALALGIVASIAVPDLPGARGGRTRRTAPLGEVSADVA